MSTSQEMVDVPISTKIRHPYKIARMSLLDVMGEHTLTMMMTIHPYRGLTDIHQAKLKKRDDKEKITQKNTARIEAEDLEVSAIRKLGRADRSYLCAIITTVP